MKTVLELGNTEAKEFFLKKESYCSVELPEYICFEEILKKCSEELVCRNLNDLMTDEKPKNVDDVNYIFLNNKDGSFGWRPFQLIHPAIYVSLVHKITENKNWESVKTRFEKFRENEKIECHSIPIAEDNKKPDKQNQILNWWQKIEQESLILSLEYSHLLNLDISDCYGSIYTHSIAWALHDKDIAKAKRYNKNLIGNVIDNHIQDMSYGQTNGIPQGSVLMDFIAEIVLGYADLLLSEGLKNNNTADYKILRYRDDYRIFTNNPNESFRIAKIITEVLSGLNFKINPNKTNSTDDIVLGSLKPDKIHWLYNKRKTNNIQQWLMQLYILGKQHPNSGMLFRETSQFLEWLKKRPSSYYKRKNRSPEVLISILVNLAYNNPRLFPLVTASLSFFISEIECPAKQKELVEKIKNKFMQLPNTDFLNIWLQRLTIKIDSRLEYPGKLCKKVVDNNIELWNSEWLDNNRLKGIILKTEIIKRDTIANIEIPFSNRELKLLGRFEQMYP